MDFLLVLIELFSLGVTAEALRAHIGSISAIFYFIKKSGQIFVPFCHNARV